MDLYYVNNDPQNTGEHQVHKRGCDYFPLRYIYLGPYSASQDALQKARDYYPEVEQCDHCCSKRSTRVFFDPAG